ncbi:hypothetical protein DITRI_Ditri08aG0018000 [Diplodiscus trichospermus]
MSSSGALSEGSPRPPMTGPLKKPSVLLARSSNQRSLTIMKLEDPEVSGEAATEDKEETTGTIAMVEVDMVVVVKELTVVGTMKVDMAMEEDMEADTVRVDTVMVDLITREATVPQMGTRGLRFRV